MERSNAADMSWSAYVAVFIVAFTSINFEIAITRIFSLIFSHYCVFLAVSAAMFGIGLGGFLAAYVKLPKEKDVFILFFLAISYVLAIVIPFAVSFFLYRPLHLTIAFFLPFVLSSYYIAHMFSRCYDRSGSVYFADLVGASLGSLSSILLLTVFSPIYAILANALSIYLLIFTTARKVWSIIFFVCLGIVLFTIRHNRIVDLPFHRIPNWEGTKAMVVFLGSNNTTVHIEKTYWSPSFRTDVLYDSLTPNVRGIFVDGGAPSIMFYTDSKLKDVQWLMQTFNYLPFLMARNGYLLSIGPGGGLDILLGRLARFERIDAVEVNPSIRTILNDYRHLNGDILGSREVAFHVDEGRNFIKRSTADYDLIYLSLVQTSTSNKLGLPLIECYLHTIEAYVDYLEHLKDGGIIALTCETELFLQRSVFNALNALEKTGVACQSAGAHITILETPLPYSPYQFLLIIKKEPYDREEISVLSTLVEGKKIIPVFIPSIYEKVPVSFHSHADLDNYINSIRKEQNINIGPVTDDKPFFYDLSTRPPVFLFWLCGIALCLSIGVGSFITNCQNLKHVVLMLLLGIGFMLVEVSMMRKFVFLLGYPTTAFSVVLFSLLLGSGIGGYAQERSRNSLKWLKIGLIVLCGVFLGMFLFGGIVFDLAFSLSNIAKYSISILFLLAIGFCLGLPFPFFIRKTGRLAPRDVGIMLAVNGFMAVFGSCLCMILAKVYGCQYTILATVAIYGLIFGFTLTLRSRF